MTPQGNRINLDPVPAAPVRPPARGLPPTMPPPMPGAGAGPGRAPAGPPPVIRGQMPGLDPRSPGRMVPPNPSNPPGQMPDPSGSPGRMMPGQMTAPGRMSGPEDSSASAPLPALGGATGSWAKGGVVGDSKPRYKSKIHKGGR